MMRTKMRGRGRKGRSAPIALRSVDVLAGIGPGVELEADDLPAGVAGNDQPTPAVLTVEELGKLLRSGEPTVHRLIRTRVLTPAGKAPGSVRAAPSRPRRPPDKPGE